MRISIGEIVKSFFNEFKIFFGRLIKIQKIWPKILPKIAKNEKSEIKKVSIFVIL
jgi:hypothetical protein